MTLKKKYVNYPNGEYANWGNLRLKVIVFIIKPMEFHVSLQDI